MKTFLIALLLSAYTVFSASPPWKVPESNLRLRVNIPERHNIKPFLPLPPELDGIITECLAYTDKDIQIPASSITSGNRILGFQFDFSGHAAKYEQDAIPPLAVSVYLLPKATGREMPVKNKVASRLVRQVRNITTRPFSAQEILDMFSSLKKSRSRENTAFVDQPGIMPSANPWKLPPERPHIAALLHWESNFYLEKDTDFACGSTSRNTTWAALVDGIPVADWYSAKLQKNILAGESAKLSKGHHTLQFLAIQRFGEKAPDFLASFDKQPFAPLLQSISPASFSHIAMEHKDNPENTASAVYEPSFYNAFIQTGHILAASIAQISENSLFINPRNTPLQIAHGKLIHDASFIPGFILKTPSATLSFPCRKLWHSGKRIDTRAKLSNLPVILPYNADINLSIELASSADNSDFLNNLLVTAAFYDGSDKVINKSVSQANGRNVINLSLKRPENAKYISFTFTVNEVPAFQPVKVILLSPKITNAQIHMEGNAAYVGDTRAILICDPLPKDRFANKIPIGNKKNLKIVILDDFSGETVAPNASKPLEQLLQEDMPGNISVTRYPIPQTAGTLGSLSAIQTLSQLIFSKPDAAILFIGFSALREGKLPTETCLQNLFFIQTCLANSIIPITVAPPPTPDIPHQNSRLFALYSKEIALAYGIPDIDLFSMQRIQNIDTNNWFFSNGTSISTPNDSSRTWMAKQTAKSIKQFFHQLNHNN